MNSRDDETLDPRHAPRTSSSRGAALDVVVGIALHPDLSRVGERAVLGRATDAFLASAQVLGRDCPMFVSSSGSERPLDDPCISRQQLEWRWVAALSKFVVEPVPGARRRVEVFGRLGEPLGEPPADISPGDWVALDDRVLLRFSLEPSGLDPARLGIHGTGVAIETLRDRCASVGSLEHAVLISGAVGAGKELAARAVHQSSPRSAGPFVAVNCAALPDALVESELFGHERGAFSGASASRSGLFEAADGGTLFLDEIAELGPAAQSKLLRTLEQKSVRAVGSAAERPVDVRIVAATHCDLDAAARAGTFREDLLSRLGMLRVPVPALEAHVEDIPRLFALFLRRIIDASPDGRLQRMFATTPDGKGPIGTELMLALISGKYPHNVRQLHALAARVAAAALAGEPLMDAVALAQVGSPGKAADRGEPERARPDAAQLKELLRSHDFVQGRVAKTLGVSHSSLDRWMRDLGIARPADLQADAIREQLNQAAGDIAGAARALEVSERGLILRMRQLGLCE